MSSPGLWAADEESQQHETQFKHQKVHHSEEQAKSQSHVELLSTSNTSSFSHGQIKHDGVHGADLFMPRSFENAVSRTEPTAWQAEALFFPS